MQLCDVHGGVGAACMYARGGSRDGEECEHRDAPAVLGIGLEVGAYGVAGARDTRALHPRDPLLPSASASRGHSWSRFRGRD